MNYIFHLCILAVIIVGNGQRRSYEGAKVFELHPTTDAMLQKIMRRRNEPGFDVWSARKSTVDMMVLANKEQDFAEFLRRENIPHTVKIDNVERSISNERNQNIRAQLNRLSSDNLIEFNRYYSYPEIVEYLRTIASKYKHLCKMVWIGKTFEGRDHYMLQISNAPHKNKPVYLVEAGIHAREWAAPATALYLIQQLVENNHQNSEYLKHLDWYIIPVTNPDGYEYSQKVDRMWRKTRSFNGNPKCYGVDPNRNFGYHWAESGSDNNQCSQTYHGPKAFSENETRTLRDVGMKYKHKIAAYTALHSYGQMLLYPWGYDMSLPADWRYLHKCGEAANQAIMSVAGHNYTVESAAGLYPAAGGSDDWFKGVAKTPVVFTIEVTGGGSEGFDLPPSELAPVVQEVVEGLKVISKCAVQSNSKRRHNKSASSSSRNNKWKRRKTNDDDF